MQGKLQILPKTDRKLQMPQIINIFICSFDFAPTYTSFWFSMRAIQTTLKQSSDYSHLFEAAFIDQPLIYFDQK